MTRERMANSSIRPRKYRGVGPGQFPISAGPIATGTGQWAGCSFTSCPSTKWRIVLPSNVEASSVQLPKCSDVISAGDMTTSQFGSAFPDARAIARRSSPFPVRSQRRVPSVRASGAAARGNYWKADRIEPRPAARPTETSRLHPAASDRRDRGTQWHARVASAPRPGHNRQCWRCLPAPGNAWPGLQSCHRGIAVP